MKTDHVVILADAHLKARHDEKEKRNIKDLELCLASLREKKIQKLILLGDFFDFWFEYSYYIPKDFFGVLMELKMLVDSGISVDYLAGNHDFYLGSFFDEHLGVKTWPNGMDLELSDGKYYIHHGDGFAANDYAYRLLKKIMRSRWARMCFKMIHPDLGMKVALYCSKVSRERDKDDDYSHGPYTTWAENFLRENPEYRGVMIGHTHRGHMKKIGGKQFINAGSWLDERTVLEYRNGVFYNKKIKPGGGSE